MDRNFSDRAKRFVQDKIAAKQLLINYVRDEIAQPYGVVVGVKTQNGGFVCGTSLCNRKADSFNKYVGIYIAYQRAVSNKRLNTSYDYHLLRTQARMVDRAERYFNNKVGVAV